MVFFSALLGDDKRLVVNDGASNRSALLSVISPDMPQPQIVQSLLDVFKNASYLGLIYTFLKDQGRKTRTRQIVEMARNRMAFWDTRLKVQLSVLEGAELGAAKAEALAAGDEIRTSTDRQLVTVNRKISKRTDLPRWKRVTLFYKPAVRSRLVKAATYSGRIMYWFAAVSVFVEVIGNYPFRTRWGN